MSEKPILSVYIASFSIKYPRNHGRLEGVPNFMFDCRAVKNPGRLDEYRPLTGLDAPVADYLDSEPSAAAFYEDVKRLVAPALEKAIERAYPAFRVWFACTGGRHRSVYFAERLARDLEKSAGVSCRVEHLDIGSNYSVDDLDPGRG